MMLNRAKAVGKSTRQSASKMDSFRILPSWKLNITSLQVPKIACTILGKHIVQCVTHFKSHFFNFYVYLCVLDPLLAVLLVALQEPNNSAF